ncbi:MAG: polysaccharide lyase family 8 super-sandwich domain-containing protein [Cellulosilyticaceae bacterium]
MKMNRRQMCFLMATVVTVNTLGGGILTAYASEVSMEKSYLSQSVNIAKAAELKIVRKETMQLQVPDKLVGEITWTSSNPNIATVNEKGLVSASEKGFSIITATDSQGNKETWKLDVMYMDNIPTVDDKFYAELREKWLGTVIGVNNDLSSENVQRVITRIDGFVEQHWTSIKTDGGVLWDAKNVANYETDPAHTRTMYLNLEWMAKGYATPESKYYKNPELLKDIEYALEWLYENGYGIQEQYGNWWQWEIGIPKALNNICVILFDELGQELINKYTDVIYFHQPDPFHSGAGGASPNTYRESEAANRVDVSMVSLVMGMLRNDYEQLVMTRDAIGSLLRYEERTESGKYIDGFYQDGSFIQHGHVPYVGTYGNVFLTGASTIVKALEGSKWEVPKEKLEILTSFGMDSFAPFIYKGAAMDMVRGRAVARDNETDRKSGHSIMGSFILLSEVVSPELAKELKTYAKNWILEDTSTDFLKGTNNIQLINLAEGILNDKNIKVVPFGTMHKNFELMDRVVHRGNGYALGLSMFSSRISNFEYMNGENVRGWHTSDGMIYLYNNDLAHYSDNYWNTVNPYKMPGTTVDTVKLDREKLENNGENGQKLFSKEDWVGGTQLGVYGVNGMALNGDIVNDKGVSTSGAKYKSLEAKKSYFMFDDEVVLLGAGINSTEGREIETIVENRKIKDDATNKVTVDGKTVVGELGKEEKVAANWAHLEGNVDGADIGYYFPSKQNIHMKKVANTGKWADVKKGSKADEVTKNYVEMWLSHGTNPTDDTYEYVLLPGKSVKDTEKYAKKSGVEILANTEKVQAVKENNLGLLAANFWEDEVTTAGDVTVNKKASVMTKNDKKTLEVAIADPTMKNNQVIEVEINESAKSVISQDKGITITQLSPTIKFTVDVKQAEGKTFNVKFNLKK